VEATRNSPSALGSLRSENPNLVVLAYWTSLAMDVSSFACAAWNGIRCNFAPLIEAGDWFVLDTDGNRVYAWTHERLSSAFLMDVTSDWQNEVPAYLDSQVMTTGLWDGVFYDWAEDDIAFLNDQIPHPIDLDRDGVADDAAYLDAAFLAGRESLFKGSRMLWAPETLLIGNAGWTGDAVVYTDALNGMMVEDFTYAEAQWPQGFGWTAVMRKLDQMLSTAVAPAVCAIQMSGRHDDYKAMRFGLCSALMLGCYYAYDGNRSCGDYDPSNGFANACGHHHTWWYDEYSVNAWGWPSGDGAGKGYLGDPLGPAYAAGNPTILLPTALNTGTPDPSSTAWRRDFEHGVVLVNPSQGAASVNLNGSYTRIHGIQDPETNDGSCVAQVTLPTRDGLILITGVTPPVNGPPVADAGEDSYVAANSVLIADDFEDGDCVGWTQDPSGSWQVVDVGGNKVLRATPPAWVGVGGSWQDFVLRARIRLGTDGWVNIHTRDANCKHYVVGVFRNHIYLSKGDPCVQVWSLLRDAPLQANAEHTVQIVAYGGRLSVFADGRLLIDLEDTDVLQSGPFSFYTADTAVELDDIELSLPVLLDGSASLDPNPGDKLTYYWQFVSRPSGSAATLSDPACVRPVFVPDLAGTYVIRLAVTDAAGAQAADETRVYAGVGSPSVFKVTPSGDVRSDRSLFGTSFRAGAADMAEWVSVSEPAEAGTVLELDILNPGAHRPSQGPCSLLVVGVVSLEPGLVLGIAGPAQGKALLALSGIVPVKVTNEGGPIQPGDLLVSSSTPGYAMRWAGPEPCPCALVGKALEPMTDERGVISVLLTSH
jgi:hypothetical protein